MIFESHAHYDDQAYDMDRDEILKSLAQNGVEYVVNVGASISTTKNTIALAEKYPFVYAAVGVHPSETEKLNEENFAWLTEQCRHKKTVAVGEIGLDYYWDKPDRKVQKYWFEKQLQLAAEEKLPIIIHSRDAAQETLDLIKAKKAEHTEGVIHCYTYTKEVAKEYLKMNFYFGVGGIVTFKNARKIKEAVDYIPIEYILLETDCPYLAPDPYRGKRNSSINLSLIAEEIGIIKGITKEEVVSITTDNAKRLFRIREN